jgi:hypothetical protein
VPRHARRAASRRGSLPHCSDRPLPARQRQRQRGSGAAPQFCKAALFGTCRRAGAGPQPPHADAFRVRGPSPPASPAAPPPGDAHVAAAPLLLIPPRPVAARRGRAQVDGAALPGHRQPQHQAGRRAPPRRLRPRGAPGGAQGGGTAGGRPAQLGHSSGERCWGAGGARRAPAHPRRGRRTPRRKVPPAPAPAPAPAPSPQIFDLEYPYQEAIAVGAADAAAAARSIYSMPAPLFCELHPFHLLLDEGCRVLQAGPALMRIAPSLRAGDEVVRHVRIRHPGGAPWEFDALVERAGTSFLILLRESMVTLKGAIVATTAPGARGAGRLGLALATAACLRALVAPPPPPAAAAAARSPPAPARLPATQTPPAARRAARCCLSAAPAAAVSTRWRRSGCTSPTSPRTT